MSLTYDPPQQWELDTVRGPRRGAIALMDSVLFLFAQYGVTNLGIYSRRPAGSSELAGQPVTVGNASTHAVGRADDFGTLDVPAKGLKGADVNRFLANTLVAGDNPDLCGIQEVISCGRRWTCRDRLWHPYHGPDGHFTHVHAAVTIDIADWGQPGCDLQPLRAWMVGALTNAT